MFLLGAYCGMMLDTVFDRLLKSYGPQGWWPVSVDSPEPVYFAARKLSGRQKFEICVGAVLTQNTNWKNAKRAIVELNKRGLMSPEKIMATSRGKIRRAVKSSGYYNQKTEKIISLSRHLERYGLDINVFFKVKNLREELLSIQGIGPETADSILLYAKGEREGIGDAYTRRILSRMGFPGKTYDDAKQLLESEFSGDMKEFHALLVRLGKETCKAAPLCSSCPLRTECQSGLRL